ncbi:MAG: class I SAM-dependent methyltransferase [Candidatus Omnitrophica bacterium]|nr:class I SAM-dependent methyltransferase [Candidatus Omnitrophota bacterium]
MICVCCGSKDFKVHLSDLLSCSSCGHITANLDLSLLNSKDIYSINYFQEGEYLDYFRDRSCFEKNFQKRLNSLLKYQATGNLLEIGSASGFFLNMASRHFNTVGYEICEDMAAYARMNFRLDVKSIDFLNSDILENTYDAVVMWDVIEHLARPDDFLKKTYSVLKQKGVLALTTGDISSFMAKVQGRQWRLIHPPTHVHYFTRSSMITFLKQHGFEVLSIQYPGYFRSVRQMLQGSVINQNQKIWNFVDKSRWAGTPIYLNLFDIMQVIARRV